MSTQLTLDQEIQVKHLVKRVLHFLAIRSRSRQEVIDYLKRHTHRNKHLVDITLVKIDHFNILNDTAFAQEFAIAKLHHGKGPYWISHGLKQKGIERSIILETLRNLDQDSILSSAKQLIGKKIPGWQSLDPFHRKAKAMTYLYGKGFDRSTIDAVIDECLHS
jgi:regulatory protein